MRAFCFVALIVMLFSSCRESRTLQLINSDILQEEHPRRLVLSDIKRGEYPVLTGPMLSETAAGIEIDYIVPETNEESIFGGIRFPELIEDGVIFSGGGAIFRFKRDGRFVWKTHNQGRGPGEYVDIGAMAADPLREEIMILSGETGNLFAYNYDGEFVDKVDLPIRPMYITVIDSAKYLLRGGSYHSTSFAWLADRSGRIVKTFSVSQQQSKVYDHGRSSAYFSTKGIGPFMDGYYMWHSDTVWYMDSNFENPKPIIIIDAEIRGGGSTIFNPVYQRYESVSGIRNRHYMYSIGGRPDGLIFINLFFDNRTLFYDTRTGLFYETPPKFVDDIDCGPDFRGGMRIPGIPDVDLLFPHVILDLDSSKIRKESALYDIFRNVKPDDNPVIRILTLQP